MAKSLNELLPDGFDPSEHAGDLDRLEQLLYGDLRAKGQDDLARLLTPAQATEASAPEPAAPTTYQQGQVYAGGYAPIPTNSATPTPPQPEDATAPQRSGIFEAFQDDPDELKRQLPPDAAHLVDDIRQQIESANHTESFGADQMPSQQAKYEAQDAAIGVSHGTGDSPVTELNSTMRELIAELQQLNAHNAMRDTSGQEAGRHEY